MKNILLSKTVRGAIIMLISPLMETMGIELVITDQSELVEQIITIIWFAITVYGRYKAEKKIVL